MKKLFLLFAFFGMVTFVANAQTCPKSKAAAAATKVEHKACAKTAEAAAKAAAMDETIESKVCSKSGNVSYYKNSVCTKSGKVSSEAVKFCTTSNKFVNVSPEATMVAAELEAPKVCSKTAAANAALTDESVEKRVCSKSGSVSYYQKAVCAKSGNVSFNEVEFCTASNKFVNVAPGAAGEAKAVAGKKACCSKSKKASCSKAEKAACSKGKKAACSKGKKAACSKKAGASDVKATKVSQEQ